MKINFFHINSTNKSLKVNRVSKVDISLDNTTSTNSHRNNLNDVTRGDFQKKSLQDYIDINNKLYSKDDESSDSNNKHFLSYEDLANLKESISNNEYEVNTKALSLGLLRYIERI